MSALFSPLELGRLRLPNRIVIAPMCQYSAEAGCATDWHLIHLGQLALSGASLLIIAIIYSACAAPAAAPAATPAPAEAAAAAPAADAAAAPAAQAGSRLDVVKERGRLICGVNNQLPGFGIVDANGAYAGFDVDFCKAVAAAVLGFILMAVVVRRRSEGQR